jgi:uncharacterized protein YyaL (SSP411 family)
MSHTPDAAPQRPPNRLIHESSPYLLQHAYNPVDWYPWGEEAFARARAEDKPLFLSVGYSACHWCHVMERESFENEAIAVLMNQHYINIKVDREERPDVDQIYMSAVQLMTQRGGWPMSVFLTPDGRPFYGGTYWPPTSRMGMPGFRDVLLKLHEYWTQHRSEVQTSAASLADAVGRIAAPQFEQAELGEDMLRAAMRELLTSADRRHGGFGGAPKFPHPMDIRVLLRCWHRFGEEDALHVARLTLDKMAQGGIYDHLGGGFHRYSTDTRWLVPHFEKMLYDNALLIPAYIELYQVTRTLEASGSPTAPGEHSAGDSRRVVMQTLEYVLREMTSPDGGFYSTQDADSEGEEGKFFVWSEDEVVALLGPEDARIFCYCYDVTGGGNWEGHNILNRPKTDAQASAMLHAGADVLSETLDRCRRKLFEARSRRIPPGRDEKILVAWNGLMIAAIAQGVAGYRGISEADGSSTIWTQAADAAESAASFILKTMRDADGRLLHSFKDGRARINAFLDDYACFIDGLVELYQATFDPRWLTAAVEMAEQMIARFADADHGGFFYTPADHEQLIARSKDAQDNATPSGNGMATTALLKLGRLTGRADLEEQGYRTLQALSGLLAEHPRAAAQALIALDFHLGPAHEIVLVDGSDPRETDAALAQLSARFLPRKVVARRPADLTDADVSPVLQPLLQGRTGMSPSLTAYVCEHGACRLPVSGAQALLSALSSG